MTHLLTAAEMGALEAPALAAGADLMERAGAGVVAAIMEEWPSQEPGAAVVFCGPGGNGGDGFVAARILKARGWTVELRFFGDESRLRPDAAEAARFWRAAGGEVLAWSPEAPPPPEIGPRLVIDALFGAGLTRAPDSRLIAAIVAAARPAGSRLVAADCPSGLCLDSGKLWGGAPLADLTVTFHAPKAGHYLAEGPRHCGKLIVKDIGLEAGGPARTRLIDAPGAFWRFDKDPDAHKYEHGHAVILSGGAGRTGAARLAARAALRVGAGLVTLASPPEAMAENAAHLTAIMLRPCGGAEDLAGLLKDERLNALLVGPGGGAGEGMRALVAAALSARRSAVLDADALTAFADEPAALFAALKGGRAVLTPHRGEFKRLLPDIAERLAGPPPFSKLDATREAAARSGAVVLLKGPDTAIAAPDGRARLVAARYDRAAPWLATAGSGDVLAGLVAGLLARGFGAFEAACEGAALHQALGRLCGPGLIAEDLPEALPRLWSLEAFRPPARDSIFS